MRILWIPHAGWKTPQRAHLFCRVLAERHEVHVTDWTADFQKPRDYLSRRYVENYWYKRRVDQGINVHGIPRLSPALLPSMRAINLEIMDRFVQKIVDEHSIDVVIGSFLARPPKRVRLIIDMFDHNPAFWRAHKKNLAYSREIAAIEAEWIERSERVICVSSVLADLLAQLHGPNISSRVSIIPNAIDFRRYRQASGETVRKRYEVGARKLVGFISALGSFAGAIRYIEAIREADDPSVAHLIVGAGEQLAAAQALAKRWRLSNVIFCGQVKWSEVPDYFAALDLGVIPFDLSDFTHSACPIKLLEYVACNKNVVSTPLEEVRRMNLPGVYLADESPRQFAQEMHRVLRMPSPPIADLAKYDIRNTARTFERILLGA